MLNNFHISYSKIVNHLITDLPKVYKVLILWGDFSYRKSKIKLFDILLFIGGQLCIVLFSFYDVKAISDCPCLFLVLNTAVAASYPEFNI